MPDEPWLWALAIILFAVVVIVALILGGAVEVQVRPPSLKFRRKTEARQSRVSVLKDADIADSEAGDISGEKHRGAAPDPQDRAVDVGAGMTVRNSKLGDITGVSTEGGEARRDSTKPDD